MVLISCTPNKQDLGNVYRGALTSTIKGFDPSQVSDLYSHICQKMVFEGLYEYKYLARPFDVEPAIAKEMPRISDDGLTYTIPMRRGVFFGDDPCFPNGEGREVTAHDFVYSIKRLADIRTESTGWWILDGKVVGLNEYRKKTVELESNAPVFFNDTVDGLKAIDDFTVQIKLTKAYPYFKYILAMGYAAIIAREAVEYYGLEFLNHPVGTGPYVLKEWRRGLVLKFEKNPNYRHGFYPTEGEPEDSTAGLLQDAGERLPFIDKVELHVLQETQPMWLNFLMGNLDMSTVPKDNYAEVFTADKDLRKSFEKKGIEVHSTKALDITYTGFNFENPFLGNHPELRKAMSLAVDIDEVIELFYSGRAIQAHSPVPPGLFGYDKDFKNPWSKYDTTKARELLAAAGFPNGEGLPEFEYLTLASKATSRQMAEHFVQDMKKIGINISIQGVTWPEFLQRLKTKKFELAGMAWGADYPDPENFLQLLYGPNEAPGENAANYKNAEYDSLFKKMAIMQDSPERLRIIQRMKKILTEDCPWIFGTHRIKENLGYKWVKNYKYHSVDPSQYKYLRIDTTARRRYFAREENQ